MKKQSFTEEELHAIVDGHPHSNTAILKPDNSLLQGKFECIFCHEITATVIGKFAELLIKNNKNEIQSLPTVNSLCTNCYRLDFFMVPSTEYQKV